MTKKTTPVSLPMTKKTTPVSLPMTKKTTLASLPSHVVDLIIARIPVSRHGMAKLISKQFYKLITSSNIFKIREFENIKEPCLFLSLMNLATKEVIWWVLEKNAYAYALRRVRLSLAKGLMNKGNNTRVAAGSSIVSFQASSTRVTSLDCRTETEETYQTQSSHNDPKLAVVDEKLYVFGGTYVEVFDPRTKTWESINLDEEDKHKIPINCSVVVLSDRVHFLHKNVCVVFDPKNGKLERNDEESFGDIPYLTSCVIGKHLFSFNWESKITVYHSTSRSWVLVKGLETSPEFSWFSTTLLCFEGKLLVLRQTPENISVTLIAVEERGTDMWGKIESSNICLILDEPAHIHEFFMVEI